MFDKCYHCGGSLADGYEIREHGRDAEGYSDEEAVCAACIEAEKPRTFLTLDARDRNISDAVIKTHLAFFQHPKRIEIGRVRYL